MSVVCVGRPRLAALTGQNAFGRQCPRFQRHLLGGDHTLFASLDAVLNEPTLRTRAYRGVPARMYAVRHLLVWLHELAAYPTTATRNARWLGFLAKRRLRCRHRWGYLRLRQLQRAKARWGVKSEIAFCYLLHRL